MLDKTPLMHYFRCSLTHPTLCIFVLPLLLALCGLPLTFCECILTKPASQVPISFHPGAPLLMQTCSVPMWKQLGNEEESVLPGVNLWSLGNGSEQINSSLFLSLDSQF